MKIKSRLDNLHPSDEELVLLVQFEDFWLKHLLTIISLIFYEFISDYILAQTPSHVWLYLLFWYPEMHMHFTRAWAHTDHWLIIYSKQNIQTWELHNHGLCTEESMKLNFFHQQCIEQVTPAGVEQGQSSFNADLLLLIWMFWRYYDIIICKSLSPVPWLRTKLILNHV